MTSRRKARNFGLAVGLFLAAFTPISAQVRLPTSAAGLAQLPGAQPLTMAQISQLAAAQSQTTPTAPPPRGA